MMRAIIFPVIESAFDFFMRKEKKGRSKGAKSHAKEKKLPFVKNKEYDEKHFNISKVRMMPNKSKIIPKSRRIKNGRITE